MTCYAIDEARVELVATWQTGYGAVASCVAALPEGVSPGDRRALAAEMTGLCEALWRCYTHPASAAGSLEVNSEGWRREQTRAGFAAVVEHLRGPNLPDEHGNLIVCYDPVEERAHRVGRCLHAVGDAALTEAVVAEVEAELAAVQRAELGDLSGRAVQAVQLTRQDASPVQVAAADQILAQNPLGGEELFLELDPTSACVAAAHWLQAAADVAAEVSDVLASEVVVEADNIEALPHATPTAVLELMERDLSPTAAVTELIRDAMTVAEGRVPDVDAVRDMIEEAEQDAEQNGRDDPAAVAEFMTIRLTTLDPRRPARDMLEDLLSGIRGCWLLYREYVDAPTNLSDEDDDGEADEDRDDAIDEAFCDAVRARAAAERYRLDLEPRPASVLEESVEADDGDDERGVDVVLEAEDVCEQVVRLVLDSGDWDVPRDIMSAVLDLEHEDSERLAGLLLARAVGYLVSFKDAGVTREQLDEAVGWIGEGHGAEYAGPAAVAAALAGHAGSQELLAERFHSEHVTVDQLADFLGTDFFPGMIWLCCGAVATLGEGDVDWLRQHRISGP